METPTVYLIGKLSSVIDEFKKATGSTYLYVSSWGNSLRITIAIPGLTNDINSINSVKTNTIELFGLRDSELEAKVEHSYSTTKLYLINRQQNLEIVLENK